MVTRGLVVVFTVTVLAGASAGAETDAERRAKAQFREATAYQEAKMYDDAIAAYEKGYAIAPLPDFLFNIAQCQRLKGDKPRALEAYRRYLEAAPDGRGSNEARQQIVALTKQIREEAVAAASQPSAPTSQPSPPASAPVAPPATLPTVVEPVVAIAPIAPIAAPAPRLTPRRGQRIAGLVVGGAGALALGAGGYFGLAAASSWDEALPHCDTATRVCDHEGAARAADANAEAVLSTICFGVGAAAVVGGVVLYLLATRETAVPAVSLVPGGAVLAIGGAL